MLAISEGQCMLMRVPPPENKMFIPISDVDVGTKLKLKYKARRRNSQGRKCVVGTLISVPKYSYIFLYKLNYNYRYIACFNFITTYVHNYLVALNQIIY